jgi:hypothetical protein
MCLQTCRLTDEQPNVSTDVQTDRRTTQCVYRHADWQTNNPMCLQTCRLTDEPNVSTDVQTDRRTTQCVYRRADWQTNNPIPIYPAPTNFVASWHKYVSTIWMMCFFFILIGVDEQVETTLPIPYCGYKTLELVKCSQWLCNNKYPVYFTMILHGMKYKMVIWISTALKQTQNIKIAASVHMK